MIKKLLIYNLILLLFTTSCSTEQNIVPKKIESKPSFSELIRITLNDNLKELILKDKDIKEEIRFDRKLLSEYFSGNPNYEIVKLLLENGARLDIEKGSTQNTLMHTLALSKYGRDPKIFKLLLDYGEDINSKNIYGDTPLISLFKSDFNLNDNLNTLDKFDSKTYYSQLKLKFIDSLNFLLENGSDIRVINKDEISFVDYLIMYNLNDLAKKYLQEKEVLDLDNKKTLSYLERAIINKNTEIVNFILEKKLYQNKKTLEKALISAVKYEKIELLKNLIQNGADINSSSEVSFSLLSQAVSLYRNGNNDFLKVLLENKININATTVNIENVLLSALLHNEKDIYNILVSNGGDLNYINSEGQNILLSRFTNYQIYNYGNTIIKLIDNGVNFNIKDNLGNNLLSYLIRIYISPSISKSEFYISPEQILRHLISKGLDVSKKFDSGFAKDKTPLILASELRKIELVKVILENTKVDINEQDNYGDTALIVASRNQDLPTIKVLLEHKADITIKNKFGNDALSIVKRFDSNRNELTYIQKDIIELLEKYEKK